MLYLKTYDFSLETETLEIVFASQSPNDPKRKGQRACKVKKSDSNKMVCL